MHQYGFTSTLCFHARKALGIFIRWSHFHGTCLTKWRTLLIHVGYGPGVYWPPLRMGADPSEWKQKSEGLADTPTVEVGGGIRALIGKMWGAGRLVCRRVAAYILPVCGGLVGSRCDGGDYLFIPQQLSSGVTDLLMIPSSRLGFLVAATVEWMIKHERHSTMQIIRLIQPRAGWDPTGVLGLWEVAHEVSQRLRRPQPPPGRDDHDPAAAGLGADLGLPEPPIRLD